MHLGRFHFVIDHLERHFRESQLIVELEAAANFLEQFSASRAEQFAVEFRNHLANAMDASESVRPELLQPYAQQVIDELGLRPIMAPHFRRRLETSVATHGFDMPSLLAELRKLLKKFQLAVGNVRKLDEAFRGLGVEYTEVESFRAELGLMIPREVVGEKIPDLTKEFDKFSNLARAMNEITGADEYDSKVLTISSSWWQIFLDIPIEQVAAWVLAIERIVALYKSNLEIKSLQRQLEGHDLPVEIQRSIDGVIEQKVKVGLHGIVGELMGQFCKIEDDARRNEVENQLRQGLIFLANRMNKGALVEINAGVPGDPEDPAAEDGGNVDQAVIEANAKLRERIAALRALRASAMRASEASLQIDRDAPLLLGESRAEHSDSERS